MKCKNCGFEAADNMKFCPACGERLPKQQPVNSTDTSVAVKQVDQILTVSEAARLLKCSRNTIYDQIYQHKIPFFRLNSRYRFKTADLLAWASQQERITTA